MINEVMFTDIDSCNTNVTTKSGGVIGCVVREENVFYTAYRSHWNSDIRKMVYSSISTCCDKMEAIAEVANSYNR